VPTPSILFHYTIVEREFQEVMPFLFQDLEFLGIGLKLDETELERTKIDAWLWHAIGYTHIYYERRNFAWARQ
jgi:hypothetical protein